MQGRSLAKDKVGLNFRQIMLISLLRLLAARQLVASCHPQSLVRSRNFLCIRRCTDSHQRRQLGPDVRKRPTAGTIRGRLAWTITGGHTKLWQAHSHILRRRGVTARIYSGDRFSSFLLGTASLDKTSAYFIGADDLEMKP